MASVTPIPLEGACPYNGMVEVRSEPGRGSLFTVHLPRVFEGSRQAALA